MTYTLKYNKLNKGLNMAKTPNEIKADELEAEWYGEDWGTAL